eukprot:12644291-Heterocapsa_arctica.AAC.1
MAPAASPGAVPGETPPGASARVCLPGEAACVAAGSRSDLREGSDEPPVAEGSNFGSPAPP